MKYIFKNPSKHVMFKQNLNNKTSYNVIMILKKIIFSLDPFQITSCVSIIYYKHCHK